MKKNSNTDFALQQIKRLRAKPFYPVADIDGGRTVNHGERELVRTLITYADSEDHMRRVINQAVIRSFGPHGEDRCPSTSDLWSLCREVGPEQPKPVVFNRDCEHCAGIGFVISEWPFGITGAFRCPNGCVPAGGFSGSGMGTAGVFRYYARQFGDALKRRSART